MNGFEEVPIKSAKKDNKKENKINNREKNAENFANELRPLTFEDYVGQDDIKEDLSIYIKASEIRNTVVPSILLFGAPGLGKTTLAQIIANEKNAKLIATSAPTISKPTDIVGTLMSLEKGDVLFIDEIHCLDTKIEELLYSVIEDYRLDIPIDKGGKTELVKIKLEQFTLIGATTRPALLSTPLRDRFKIEHQLKFYTDEELSLILMRSSKILDVILTKEASLEIAKRSRSVARIANNLLERITAYAIVKNSDIHLDFAIDCLNKFKIDKLGLSGIDRKYLANLHFILNNKATGLKTLSQYLNEDEKTIELIVEPFLMNKGLITRTQRGRKLTKDGIDYIIENLSKLDLR